MVRVEQARRVEQLDDLTGVHDGDAIGVARDERHVVRDEDDREPKCALQLLHLRHEGLLSDDVERRCRLVHDHQLGCQQIAIATIARCRIPPLSWCGWLSDVYGVDAERT